MVSKVLALAVIVAAVGAVAVETPLAGKSESGIESPAARSAEYEDTKVYGRDLTALEAKVERLEAKNGALEAKNGALEEKMAVIEAKFAALEAKLTAA